MVLKRRGCRKIDASIHVFFSPDSFKEKINSFDLDCVMFRSKTFQSSIADLSNTMETFSSRRKGIIVKQGLAFVTFVFLNASERRSVLNRVPLCFIRGHTGCPIDRFLCSTFHSSCSQSDPRGKRAQAFTGWVSEKEMHEANESFVSWRHQCFSCCRSPTVVLLLHGLSTHLCVSKAKRFKRQNGLWNERPAKLSNTTAIKIPQLKRSLWNLASMQGHHQIKRAHSAREAAQSLQMITGGGFTENWIRLEMEVEGDV